MEHASGPVQNYLSRVLNACYFSARYFGHSRDVFIAFSFTPRTGPGRPAPNLCLCSGFDRRAVCRIAGSRDRGGGLPDAGISNPYGDDFRQRPRETAPPVRAAGRSAGTGRHTGCDEARPPRPRCDRRVIDSCGVGQNSRSRSLSRISWAGSYKCIGNIDHECHQRRCSVRA